MNPTEPDTAYLPTHLAFQSLWSPLYPRVPPEISFPRPSPRQTSQIRAIPLGVRDVNSVSK